MVEAGGVEPPEKPEKQCYYNKLKASRFYDGRLTDGQAEGMDKKAGQERPTFFLLGKIWNPKISRCYIMESIGIL